MIKFKFIFSAIFALAPFANFACGPYFPETYLDNGKYNGMKKPSEYSYSWEQELEYIILEKYKNLSQWHIYSDSKVKTEDAEILDYKEKISPKNHLDRSPLEFELYKAGKKEMHANHNPAKIPK